MGGEDSVGRSNVKVTFFNADPKNSSYGNTHACVHVRRHSAPRMFTEGPHEKWETPNCPIGGRMFK